MSLQESQHEVCDDVKLDVFLANGFKICINIKSTDQTEDVLEVCLKSLTFRPVNTLVGQHNSYRLNYRIVASPDASKENLCHGGAFDWLLFQLHSTSTVSVVGVQVSQKCRKCILVIFF